MIGEKQRFRVMDVYITRHGSRKFFILKVCLEHESGEPVCIYSTDKNHRDFIPLINNMLAAMDCEPIQANGSFMLIDLVRRRVQAHKNKYVAIDTKPHSYVTKDGTDRDSITYASDRPFHKTYQKIGANIIQPKS